MADITITIKDLPDGKVEFKSDPNFSEIAKMAQSGHELTNAHGYAMFVMNRLYESTQSKNAKQSKDSLIYTIPKVGL